MSDNHAYISNLSMYGYSNERLSGSVTIQSGTDSVHINLSEADGQKVASVLYKIIEERKTALAKSIERTNFTPALEYQPNADGETISNAIGHPYSKGDEEPY